MQVRPDLKEEMAATKEQAAREERLRVAFARLSASSSHVVLESPPSAAAVSPVQRRRAPSEVAGKLAGGGVGALGSPSGGAERAMLAAAAIAPPPQAELMASLMVEVAEAEDELAEAEGTAEVLEYMQSNIAALRTDLRRAKERGEAERDHLNLVIAREDNEREHARSQAQQAVHELNRAREREAKRSAQRAARLAKLRKEQELAHHMATDPRTVQPHPLLVKLAEEKMARLDAATAVAARDAAEGLLENASKQAKVKKQLARLEHAFAHMSSILRIAPGTPLQTKLRHVVEFVRNGDRTMQVQMQETSARRDRLAAQLLQLREALAQWQVVGGGGSGSCAEGGGAKQGREGGEAVVAGTNQPAVSVSTANVVAAAAAPIPPVGSSPLGADELEEVRLQARREAEARMSEAEERHDGAQKLAERASQQLRALQMALANAADWTVGAIRRVEREVREQRKTMEVAAVEANESAEAVRPRLPSGSPPPLYHLPTGSPRRRQRSSIQLKPMPGTGKGAAAIKTFEHGQSDGAVTSPSPSASSLGSPSSVFLTAVAEKAEETEERAGSLDRASRLSSMTGRCQRGAAKGVGGAIWSFGGPPVPAPTAAADDDDGDDDDDDRARLAYISASVAASVPATVTGGNYSDALGIFDEEDAERDGVEPLARLEQALAALMVVAAPLLDAREGEENARAATTAAAARTTAAREAPTKAPTKALTKALTSAHSSPTTAWPLPEGQSPPASSSSALSRALQAPPAPSTAPARSAPSAAPQLSASLSAPCICGPRAVVGAAPSEPRAVASTRTGQPSPSLDGVATAAWVAPSHPSSPPAGAAHVAATPSPSARRRGADKPPPFSREELKAASAKVLKMGKTRDAHKRAPPTPAQLKASRAALEYIKLARSAGASSGACFKTNLALVRLKAAATDHWGRPQTIPHLGKDLATSKSELLWMERPSQDSH